MANYLLVAGGLMAGGQPWSIRGYATSSSAESVVETGWDAAFTAFWSNASLIALMPTTTSLTYTYTSTLTTNFKQSTKTLVNHNTPGTSTGAALPSQVALICTLRTALASKAGHGRWYLPAPSASALAATGNLWAAATMTTYQTAIGAMGTSRAGLWQWQIFHRNATRSGLAAGSMTPVTGSDASNKPAIQRRRGDKVVPTRTIVNV